ncbi:MAG: hypothetical protein AAB567_00060 [Patescibacteria group bacterium]
MKNIKSTIPLMGLAILFLPAFVFADVLSQRVVFLVDPEFDFQKRSMVAASLQVITDDLYFYIEDEWWNSLPPEGKQEVGEALGRLGVHFQQEIYPTLTKIFGSENRPGVDKDAHITVLIHRMKQGAKGYFNTADGYPKLQAPRSNEREMVYLGSDAIGTPLAKNYLAHEFMHLIYFNQKERIRGISDEIWMQEGFAELAPWFVGYEKEFEESYFSKRIKDFIGNPRNSLTEWKGLPEDYGVVSVFFRYLIDHYGTETFVEMLKVPKAGIATFNEVFAKRERKENFSQVFTNWTVAVFLNDCSYGERYCFKDEHLQNLRILPFTSFLLPFGESQLTVTNPTKNWAGNWHKISGGKGALEITFEGNPIVRFQVPYLIQKNSGAYDIGFFDLTKTQKGKIRVEEFGATNTAVVILPSIQNENPNFDSSEPSYLFSWTAATTNEELEKREEETNRKERVSQDNRAKLIGELAKQIEILKREVMRLQAQVALVAQGKQPRRCAAFARDLFFGLQDDENIRCLQEFFASQGTEIYPERLVTGNFFELTHAAAIRFQEKYASEILAPLGMQKGTGFVGSLTRKKINALRGLTILLQGVQ